jgi:hypothetical protein
MTGYRQDNWDFILDWSREFFSSLPYLGKFLFLPNQLFSGHWKLTPQNYSS